MSKFFLLLVKKMAQIIGGGLMNLYKLNVKKGKNKMNKTENTEPKIAQTNSFLYFLIINEFSFNTPTSFAY